LRQQLEAANQQSDRIRTERNEARATVERGKSSIVSLQGVIAQLKRRAKGEPTILVTSMSGKMAAYLAEKAAAERPRAMNGRAFKPLVRTNDLKSSRGTQVEQASKPQSRQAFDATDESFKDEDQETDEVLIRTSRGPGGSGV